MPEKHYVRAEWVEADTKLYLDELEEVRGPAYVNATSVLVLIEGWESDEKGG